jgi:tRNA(Ile)-lysidine synthase
MNKIVEKVKNYIKTGGLIVPGEHVLVGFSGGPDSTFLLLILNKIARQIGFELSACYVNHNIRPRAAKKEIVFCSNFCQKRKIPFILVDADVPGFAQDMKISLEEAGREFRYLIFSDIARQNNCQKIAVGHHQDDIIETILFRLFRGTGPQGLDPIKPLSGNIIRPLLEITRPEIEQYLGKNKINYLIDHSNLKSGFSRNYLRNRVIPLIEKKFGAKFRSSISNFTKIIAEQDDCLKKIAQEELSKISSRTPGGKIVVDLNRLGAYDSALRKRMMKLAIESISGRKGAGSFDEISRLDTIISGKIKSADFGSGIRVSREKDVLIIWKKRSQWTGKRMPIGGIIDLPEISSQMKSRIIPNASARLKKQKGGLRIHLDANKIQPPLQIRPIKPGDSFTPLGLNGKKKIGDFLTDKKVPRYLRDEIPVVLDRKGIIWLAGYQISDNCKIEKNSSNILEMEFLRGKIDADT